MLLPFQREENSGIRCNLLFHKKYFRQETSNLDFYATDNSISRYLIKFKPFEN